MGRVFTFNAIFANGVPALDDFPFVANHIRKALKEEKGVTGALFYGSILGGWNRRSDIDCLVVYDPAQKQEVFMLLGQLATFGRRFKIPLEFVAISEEVANMGLHTISFGLGYHFLAAAKKDGVIKGNPISMLKMNAEKNREEVRSYLIRKNGRLTSELAKMPAMKNRELCAFLQKVLEAPVHVARKLLQVKRQPMCDYPKQTIIACYPAVISSAEASLLFGFLDLNARYDQELENQLLQPDQRSYRLILEEIKKAAWHVQGFIEHAMECLD